MKKLISIVAVIVMSVSVVGCGAGHASNTGNTGRFIVTEGGISGYTVYRDTETGVEYFVPSNGGATVIVDADGKPLIRNAE